MKIVSIKFLNLNSLKGLHEVRFDQPPFTESGLFAITGPTGAGKTTILDAITVALYGRVHRHNKDVAEIMTRHTAESFSEVEFLAKDKLYRAKWSIRRSRGKADGALQTNKMELADTATNEIIINHPLQQVQQAIIDLCGLDYDQFLRSVMLSQGDFTRFLKADENERSELLERMTDTGIYSDISILAFERKKEEQQKLETLRLKLNDVLLLTEAEKQVYEEKLYELSQLENSARTTKTEIENKLNWLLTIENLIGKKELLSRELEVQETLEKENQPRFQQLKLHKQALVFKPALAEIKTVKEQQDKSLSDLQNENLALPELKTKAESAAQLLKEAQQDEEASQTELRQIDPVLEEVISKDAAIQSKKEQVTKSNLAFANATAELDQLYGEENKKNKKLAEAEQQLTELQTWIEAHENEAFLSSVLPEFRQFRNQLQETKISLLNDDKELISFKKDKNGNEQKLVESKIDAERLKNLVEQATADHEKSLNNFQQITSEKSLEAIETEAMQFPSLIAICEQQEKLAISYLQLNNQQTRVSSQLMHDKEAHDQLNIKLEQLQQEKTIAEDLLQEYQTLVETELRIQNYDQDRQQLQKGKACPLCGSVHHPFADNQYKSHVSEAEQRRNQQQQTLKTLLDNLNQYVNKANILFNTIQSTEKTLIDLKIEEEAVLKDFAENNQKLPKPLDIHNQNIIRRVIDSKKELQDRLLKKAQEIKLIQTETIQTERRIFEYKEKLSAVVSIVIQLSDKIGNTENQITRVSSEIENLKEREKLYLQKATDLLTPFQIKFKFEDYKTIESLLISQYNEFKKNTENLQRLKSDHIKLSADLKNVIENVALKTKALQKLKDELGLEKEFLQKLEDERYQLFGDKNPRQERERLTEKIRQSRKLTDKLQLTLQEQRKAVQVSEARIEQLSIHVDERRRKLNQLIQTLEADLKQIGIKSIEALTELFLPEKEATESEFLQKKIESDLNSGRRALQDTLVSLEKEHAKQLTSETKESLDHQLKEVDLKVSGINQEIGKFREKLDEDAKMKLKFSDLARQVEVQQKDFAKWEKLSALIGSADGKKFSRFAQGLTLARLTDLANRHLVKLSDRYKIVKTSQKDLELQITDHYQADVVRPISTLSGGESFLVSLALALGLSDLASRKTQIHSLFIDEGFGTLDAETLDVAITSLENLQANGKTIGIISHVEALKERIGTQIEVSKEAGGVSKIKIRDYVREY